MSLVCVPCQELCPLVERIASYMIGCLVLAPVSLTVVLLQAPNDMKPTYSPILAYSPDVSQLNATLYQTLSTEFRLEDLQ